MSPVKCSSSANYGNTFRAPPNTGLWCLVLELAVKLIDNVLILETSLVGLPFPHSPV